MFFYYFRIIGLWLSMTLLGNACAQSAASDEAFQGLKWKDPVKTILKHFPTASSYQLKFCNPKKSRDFSGIDCSSLQMSEYVVAGLTFDVTFYLAYLDKTLAEVGLSTLTWAPSGAEVDGGRSSSIAKCNELQSLLAVRYGYATVTYNADKRPNELYRTVHWYYGEGSSHVELTCFLGKGNASFTISYTPKVPIEANKL